MKKQILVALGVVALLALILVPLGIAQFGKTPSTIATTTEDAAVQTTGGSSQSVFDDSRSNSVLENVLDSTTNVDADEADAIAQALFEGTTDRIEQAIEDGVLVWKVRITADGQEANVRIDADTGEIVRYRVEDAIGSEFEFRDDSFDDSFDDSLDDNSNDGALESVVDSTTPISSDEAISIALAEFEGTVDRVEQEFEDGILVWNVRIDRSGDVEADIRIDAQTGDIVRFRIK